jgi:NifU-like protein
MWDYTDKVRDHYLHPRNVGEIENPDGFGEVGNISCGDALRLTFKLNDKGVVEDIKFKTFGCGSAIASASILTELCKGKSLEELRHISNKDIADALDGLPKEKMHCSVMGEEALEAAISFYETDGKVSTPPQKDGRVVCHCFGITDKEIEKAVVENGLKTLADVTNFTKAGGACGKCHKEIQSMIDKFTGAAQVVENKAPIRMTTLQKIDKIREVIASDVRPILAQDGGDCELVDVDGNDVYVELIGHCKGCAFSNNTLVSVVEKKLREKISDQLNVKLS